MLSFARITALLLLGLGSSAWPATAPDVESLLARIQKERDAVDPAVFAELALDGSREAYRALVKALQVLKEEHALAPACSALARFGSDPELGPLALTKLVEESERKRELSRVRAATRGLVELGLPAVDALVRIAEAHPEASVRTLACDALVLQLGARCEVGALAILLANASLDAEFGGRYLPGPDGWLPEPGQTRQDVLRHSISACDSAEIRALWIQKLTDPKAGRSWKLFMLELLGERLGKDVTDALVAALSDADDSVVLAALHQFENRGGWEGHESKLRALLHHREQAVRRAAVHALGRMLVEDKAWLQDVAALTSSKDLAMRMGAAAALAERRTSDAVASLHTMLSDGEWSVRAEVLQHLANLRQKESIPILIAQLERERGRMREDVYAVLRLLTGLDHGHLAPRWESWWKGEGESFALPSLESAQRLELDRQKRVSEGRTVSTTLYGVQVVSERVAFVLDVSGSMLTTAGIGGTKAGEEDLSRPTRMDVAKEQLSNVIRSLPEDTLFNIVFFESQVTSLHKHLLRMNKANRARALSYIHDQFALGATALYPALQLVFSDPLVDTIYLLTDGAPTVGEITDIVQIRAEVARWNSARHVKIHGITMGQDSTLLYWLTQDTGGTYQRID